MANNAVTVEKACSSTSYLPECWSDDERMSCLMSMFKNRTVNPAEYDSKLKFWSSLILSSSGFLKRPFFTKADLLQRFKRKDRLPAGLPVVVNNMLTSGDIIPLEKFTSDGAGWMRWTFESVIKKPFSWLMGYTQSINIDEGVFILPKVLQDLSHKVMEIRREETQKHSPTDLCCPRNIVEYRKFSDQLKPHGFDEKSVFLIVEHLQRIGLISVDVGEKGEKLIKFPDDESSDENTQITTSDKKFFKLQKLIETLENDLLRLEDTVVKLDEEARLHIRSKNKPKAKQCLRQKLALMKQIKTKEAACNNGITLMNQLAQTKEQRQILDAFKSGVDAFKTNMAEHGMSVDKVEETMDDLHEAMSDYEDINSALSRGVTPSSPLSGAGMSDEELENELADLLKDTTLDESKGFKLPEVPQISTSTPIAKSKADEDNLKRLRRLLEAE